MKIDQQCEVKARCLQVVDALRQVLVCQLFGAFDLHEQPAIDDQVRRIRADMLTLVGDWESSLCGGGNATQT